MNVQPQAPMSEPEPAGHALTAWSDACAPGGLVCAVPVPGNPDGICGVPVESEPCGEHPGVTTPPQALAARMDVDAADWERQAARHRDMQKFALAAQCAARAATLREWSGALHRKLAPQWDALQRDRDDLATLLDGCQDELRTAIDGKREVKAERDEARRNLAAVKSVEASAEKFHRDTCAALEAELAACRERNAAIAVQSDKYRDERDDARDRLDEIRAMVDATRPHFSAEQLGIVLRAIHEAAGLEPQS